MLLYILVFQREEELNSIFTDKQKETFEKFKDCTSELSFITEREEFCSNFILAVSITVKVMQGLEEIEDKSAKLHQKTNCMNLPNYLL